MAVGEALTIGCWLLAIGEALRTVILNLVQDLSAENDKKGSQ